MSMDAQFPIPSRAMLARLYRLSVAQYHKMIEFGILTTDDRVELIEGLLVQRFPRSPEHDHVVRRAAEAFTSALSRASDEQTIQDNPGDHPRE